MVDITLSITGLPDLQADFARLARATGNKVARAAVMAGAKVARDKARQAAPVRTGALRKGIIAVSVKQRDTPGEAAAGVRVRSPGKKSKKTVVPFYWKFIELGTSKLRAAPFIRPSWDGNLAQIEQAVSDTLAAGIDKAITEAGR